MKTTQLEIAVLGLGYVLALALARQYKLTGFDVNSSRVSELAKGNGESSNANLRSTTSKFTCLENDLWDHDIFILTVPTVITDDFKPDVESATKMVGKCIKKDAIACYKYPSKLTQSNTCDYKPKVVQWKNK